MAEPLVQMTVPCEIHDVADAPNVVAVCPDGMLLLPAVPKL